MTDDAASELRRRPLADVLTGLEIHELLPGWTPLEAVVLVKCLDDEGHPSWSFRTTPGINDEELLGVLQVRTDLLRRDLMQAYTSSDDD